MFVYSILFLFLSFALCENDLTKVPKAVQDKADNARSLIRAIHERDQGEKAGVSYCETCWGLADEALESWVEIFLYGGTFYSCAQFCTEVENWGDACIAICSILGDQAFFELLNYTDLDPVYMCQLLGACPIDDSCPPASCVTIYNYSVKPNSIYVPPSDQDWVDIWVYFTVNKKWSGTGVVYYQMQQCQNNNCVFLANNAALLEPNGVIGKFAAHFTFNYDCPIEFSPGIPITAQVFICNGNCDEYGVARHPHSALYATTQANIATDGGCE